VGNDFEGVGGHAAGCGDIVCGLALLDCPGKEIGQAVLTGLRHAIGGFPKSKYRNVKLKSIRIGNEAEVT
jgi:hypothetical protein